MTKTSRILLALIVAAASVTAWAIQDDIKNWSKVTTSDGKLSFQFPDGWLVADDKDPVFIQAQEDFVKKNPKFGQDMKARQGNQILQVYNIGDDLGDEVLDNMNVVKDKNPGITAANYKEVGGAILQQLGVKGEHKVIDLPFGKTLTYSATIKVNLPDGGTKDMDLLGYLVLKGEDMFVISFATGGGELKQKRAVYEKIVKTGKFS